MKSGFITLVGAPNAGKSTLLNALLGTKIAIVSPKAQTTRTRTLGVLTEEQYQMVFIDTPGIFSGKRRLDRAMVSNAWESTRDVDAIILLVDASVRTSDDTKAIVEKIKSRNQLVILALNKIDEVPPAELLPMIEDYDRHGAFSDIVMISARQGDGLDELKTLLKSKLPLHPFYYDPDHLTDTPQRLLAAEITREQFYFQLNQELPYAAMVEHESFEEFQNGDLKISQSIVVGRESQKAIILGKGGIKIKTIRENAQREMKKVFGQKVHLFLNVKVKEQWDEQKSFYKEWGLEHNS